MTGTLSTEIVEANLSRFLPEELLGGPGGEEGDGEEGDLGDGIYGYVYIYIYTYGVLLGVFQLI